MTNIAGTYEKDEQAQPCDGNHGPEVYCASCHSKALKAEAARKARLRVDHEDCDLARDIEWDKEQEEN